MTRFSAMSAIALALFLTLLAGTSHAVSRYVSTSLTCAEIKAKIQSERQAILAWNDPKTNLPRYGLYIANRSVCLPGNGTDRVYVPAKDKKSCMVKRCMPLDLQP
ncbi:MAG: hypothetical protein NTV73_11200 [Hyphomicrobiales bacterium]|nr:hypothetical protein [Hyphomicrobiales bacterium]